MDKNPKHPLKKKKVVQKVYATANHNAAATSAIYQLHFDILRIILYNMRNKEI